MQSITEPVRSTNSTTDGTSGLSLDEVEHLSFQALHCDNPRSAPFSSLFYVTFTWSRLPSGRSTIRIPQLCCKPSRLVTICQTCRSHTAGQSDWATTRCATRQLGRHSISSLYPLVLDPEPRRSIRVFVLRATLQLHVRVDSGAEFSHLLRDPSAINGLTRGLTFTERSLKLCQTISSAPFFAQGEPFCKTPRLPFHHQQSPTCDRSHYSPAYCPLQPVLAALCIVPSPQPMRLTIAARTPLVVQRGAWRRVPYCQFTATRSGIQSAEIG